MGSGKTTVAKKLAGVFKYGYLDLDEQITKESKKSITAIFEEEGENSFRMKEQKVLHATTKLDKTVIATGGGTPCFFDNMDWMNQEGITVYLEANAGLLFHRLLKEKSERPLLSKLSEIELMEYIQEHLAQRAPYYSQSQVKVKAASVNVNLLAEKIKKAIQKSAVKKSK